MFGVIHIQTLKALFNEFKGLVAVQGFQFNRLAQALQLRIMPVGSNTG